MANRERGEVAIELDGKTYLMKFDMNALIHIEEATDKSYDEVFASLSAKPRLKLVRAVLWGALVGQHPDLTEDAVGTIISQFGIVKVVERMNAAAALMTPEQKKGAGADADADPTNRTSPTKQPADGTGTD